MKLSIILPAIRVQNWKSLYETACTAVGKYADDFEMILVGPTPPLASDIFPENFIWIEDWGAPARCAQKGAAEARGEYMTWGSDDGVFLGNSLEESVDVLEGKKRNTVLTMRYAEGGNSPGPEYWIAHTHADLRLPGIPSDYRIAPVGMYTTSYFKELGGWDCRFEHLNMCCHDLAFRVQNDGGELLLSPSEVMSCTWDVQCEEWQPIGAAYRENDLPLFNEIYTKVYDPSRISIEYNNWESSPSRFVRRFGNG